MKTLAQLSVITTPCQILNESATNITVKRWNRIKAENFPKPFFSKDRLIKSSEQDLQNAIRYATDLQNDFDAVKIGDIRTYSIGFDCTLHQFAKVVRKTNKTIFLQLFEYQGMSQEARPTKLTEEIIRVGIQKLWKYRPYDSKRKYYNNED